MSRRAFTVRTRSELVAATLRSRSGLVAEFLANGALFALRHDRILVNQLLGDPLAGGLANVHVRLRERAGVSWTPLIGPAAPTSFFAAPGHVRWHGGWRDLEVECVMRLADDDDAWTWTLRVTNGGRRPVTVDAVLGQDVGIGLEAAVRTNELYTSQYIDHTVLRDAELGDLVCSRQNLEQDGRHPWLLHGCLPRAVGFLTDGFQLFGLGYRATGVPEALGQARLASRRYQYEAAMAVLQSAPARLAPGASTRITFFALFRPDHPAASGPDDAAELARALRVVGAGGPHRADLQRAGQRTSDEDEDEREVERPPSLFDAPVLFVCREPPAADLERFAPKPWRHVESLDGTLLSFFRGDGEHVVLRAKEIVQERPTGHILRSGRDLLPSDDTLTVTAWMDGVFGAQLALGNSTFHKLLTVRRHPLDAVKGSGRRIFVRSGSGWRLLGLPSAFAMTPDSARWLYDDGERAFAVRLSSSPDDPACILEIEVLRGGPLAFLVADNVVVGQDEHEHAARIEVDRAAARIELAPGAGERMRERYPGATFHVGTPDPGSVEAIGGDGPLFADGVDRNHAWVTVTTKPVERFTLVATGSLEGVEQARALAARYAAHVEPWPERARQSETFRASVDGRLALSAKGSAGDRAARLTDACRWFAHDGLIHLSTPHGLEQYGGAAWGLRDVCQGPVELLLAERRFGEVRRLLGIVYGEQERGTGDWRQWFMVDRHRDVRAPDSHADIVHWPLQALCDYVEATGDAAILDERVGYSDDDGPAETIARHSERQLDRIEASFVPGTALVRFGHGDWEDTLQPADPAMAERLVSSWTVELAYEAISRYAAVCDRAGLTGRAPLANRLADLAARIRADFNRHLVPDGIVAGLAEFAGDEVRYLLHPRDRRTGVSYRLLPMSRGILSGLFTPGQAASHARLIRRHLSFPDGVRLMDRPIRYQGGMETIFRRAESAANFGREIGLMYVHAHLRYVQAMTRMGLAEEALAGLLAVCPIDLPREVPTALPRQANAYFSSSDAAFADRGQADRQFGRVRSGRVGVKGGWRVYSSGPGLFINHLVSRVLGIRPLAAGLLLDPVLPASMDGLTVDVEHEGRRVRYRYRVRGAGFGPDEVRINGRRVAEARRVHEPYRRGGLLVPRAVVDSALSGRDAVVEIVT